MVHLVAVLEACKTPWQRPPMPLQPMLSQQLGRSEAEGLLVHWAQPLLLLRRSSRHSSSNRPCRCQQQLGRAVASKTTAARGLVGATVVLTCGLVRSLVEVLGRLLLAVAQGQGLLLRVHLHQASSFHSCCVGQYSLSYWYVPLCAEELDPCFE
jgi:hypothetical protein